jgi:DHA2 family methylenomycin A resistance protein-like MFS transporter
MVTKQGLDEVSVPKGNDSLLVLSTLAIGFVMAMIDAVEVALTVLQVASYSTNF